MDSYDLYKKIDYLAENDQLKEALHVLENGLINLPKEALHLHYSFFMGVRCYFEQTLKMYDELYKHAKELIDKGISISSHRFINLPDNIKDSSKYIELMDRNNLLLNDLKKNTKVSYEVELPINYTSSKKYPIFLVLHQGGDNIPILKWYWNKEPFIKQDCIIAYVQSSQVLRHNAYGWMNDSIARNDIKKCFNDLIKNYSIDENKVFIGGYYDGGIIAIDIAFGNMIPIKGFITLSARGVPQTFTKNNLIKAKYRDVKGVFIDGEYGLPDKAQDNMCQLLDDTGIPYQFIINKGVDDRAPHDLSEKLSKALEFLLV